MVIPGVISDPKHVCAGVPQGSILGPLLFLVYINDTVEEIVSNINLFAGDTCLFRWLLEILIKQEQFCKMTLTK